MFRSVGKSAGNLRRHAPFSKAKFEEILHSISGFDEFPGEWYEVNWIEDGDKWIKTDVVINERCYYIPLTFDPVRLIKIYSTVDRDEGWSREVRTDAIRIVLADISGAPKHTRFKRINRNGKWKYNLKLRISELMESLGIETTCRCGQRLFLKRNSKKNSRFLGCSMFPKCDYKKNFYV